MDSRIEKSEQRSNIPVRYLFDPVRGPEFGIKILDPRFFGPVHALEFRF